MTGYYGIPGSRLERDVTKVHYVLKGKPICGTRMRKAMVFQWCAPGFESNYCECDRCKDEYRRVVLPPRKEPMKRIR